MKPEYLCKYCGAPSWVHPLDQEPPPDYCHEGDHGEPPEPEPDAYCYTDDDGSCVSADPKCMHNAAQRVHSLKAAPQRTVEVEYADEPYGDYPHPQQERNDSMSQAREIAEQLDAIRGYAKPHPSGAQGQVIGQETWRITLSGNALQAVTDAADKLIELEQQRDKLLAALETLLAIANDSQGVAGYHLNGDVADWDSFQEIAEAEVLIAEVKGQS